MSRRLAGLVELVRGHLEESNVSLEFEGAVDVFSTVIFRVYSSGQKLLRFRIEEAETSAKQRVEFFTSRA